MHFESLYPVDARHPELEKVLGFVKEGNSCQIVGIPGIGRANMLGFLAYNKHIRSQHLGENAKWFHFVLVNFTEVKQKPLLEVTKLIFLELVDSLQERKMEEEYKAVRDIFKDSLSFQDELVLFQGLKKALDYLALEKELTVVLLFERFEEYIPTVTKDFFSNLRILRNKAKYRFSVVFSLTRPLEDFVDSSMLADFYEFLAGHVVYPTLLDKPGLAFRVAYLEKISNKQISQAVLDKILDLTQGHGKLTRLSLEKSLADNLSPTDITVEKLLSYKTIQGALWEIWYYLTPGEQQLFLNSQQEPIHNAFLEQVHLVRDGNITIPLFAAFIATRQENQNQETNKITWDPATNIIKRGEDILSDMLTAAEYRLLRLLLQHENEVVDRETIINAVWKDSASVAGVTDQAVDQLVFRLRKKIETNPNNPAYIQTIKGRGIKFNQ